MKRKIVDHHGPIRIPAAWRGNCECGHWLVVLKSFTIYKPLQCECGRAWYVKDDEALYVAPPLSQCMANVTGAVLAAEGAVKDAIVYYERLVYAERAIALHPDASEDDKRIARRGVKSAMKTYKGLLKVFPWKRDKL